jgi:hypothetical protein
LADGRKLKADSKKWSDVDWRLGGKASRVAPLFCCAQQPRVNDPPERRARLTTKARRTRRRTKEEKGEKEENTQGGPAWSPGFHYSLSLHSFVLLGELRAFVVNLPNPAEAAARPCSLPQGTAAPTLFRHSSAAAIALLQRSICGISELTFRPFV